MHSNPSNSNDVNRANHGGGDTVGGGSNNHQQHRTSERSDQSFQNRLCHYFSNTGWCRFEERTGRQCRFVHSYSPQHPPITMCRLGINCTQLNCNFAHPRTRPNVITPQNRSFLEHTQSNHSTMNHCQHHNALNPWTNCSQEQTKTRSFPNQNQLVRRH